MIANLGFANTAKPQDVIRKQLEDCVKAHPTNPGVIACNQTAIAQANQAIADSVDYIKNHILVGEDAHGHNLESERPLVDAQVQSFQGYRKSSGTLSAVANGGTGSDQKLADSSTQAELSLRELTDLREQFSLDLSDGR